MTKSVYVPQEGDYLTDDKSRMVEVTGKTREGYTVVDIRVPVDAVQDAEPEVILAEVLRRQWRKVDPE